MRRVSAEGDSRYSCVGVRSRIVMNPLLDAAAEWLEIGAQNVKRGFYYYAGLKYTQAWTSLLNFTMLRDAGTIVTTGEEERRLKRLYGLLVERLKAVGSKMKNGNKMSGPRSDSPADAVEALLEEVLQGL